MSHLPADTHHVPERNSHAANLYEQHGIKRCHACGQPMPLECNLCPFCATEQTTKTITTP